MKRIICLLVALVLCLGVFTSCELIGGMITDEGVDKAHTYLSEMYKEALEGTHTSDFDVVAQVVIGGVKYPLKWKTDNNEVKIRDSVKPNYYTIDIPDNNEEEFTFTLTATVTSLSSLATKDKSFSIKVPAATAEDVLSIPAAIELGKAQGNSQYTSEKYYVSGTVKSITNETYGNLYIEDADGNELLVYGTYDATGKTRFDKMTTKPKVGDSVTFYSVVGNYNGTPQLKNAWLTALNGETLGTPDQGGNGGSSSAAAVLDLMGTTNLGSNTEEQTVYSANGITYTNDKASSKTPNYSNIQNYAARAYAGSTIKIEYTGMTKIVITFDDYVNNEGKSYMSGFDGMTVEGATFVRDNDVLTIYFTEATNVFQSDALASQVRIEQIEVFTGKVETPPAGGNGGNDSTGSYEAPVAGKAYKFYLEQKTAGKTLYFVGTMDSEKGTYLATTEDKSAAVDIYFEAANGGYYIYFMNGNTKTYINAEAYLKDNGYAGCHFQLVSAPVCVWTYNTQLGILEVYGEIEGKSDTFFAGTHSDYTTISLSGEYYKSQISSGTQFPARILPSNGSSQGGNSGSDSGNQGGNTDTNLPDADSELTIEDAIAIGKTYASSTDYSGHYTPGKYYVSGTIVEIANAKTGNMYIADEAGNKILVYGSFNADGSLGYGELESKPLVGDLVTVYGVVGAYGPTAQILDGWVTIDQAHTHKYSDATCTTAKTCEICNSTDGNALGHKDEAGDGYCDVCQENLNATIYEESFSIAASEGNLVEKTITWNSDNFIFTGAQANSNTKIRTTDTDHFRIYQGSTFTIEGNNGQKITKVVITVTENKYVDVLVNSLKSNGVSTSVNGKTITLEVDAGSIDSIEFSATAQFRVSSFVISYK